MDKRFLGKALLGGVVLVSVWLLFCPEILKRQNPGTFIDGLLIGRSIIVVFLLHLVSKIAFYLNDSNGKQ